MHLVELVGTRPNIIRNLSKAQHTFCVSLVVCRVSVFVAVS